MIRLSGLLKFPTSEQILDFSETRGNNLVHVEISVLRKPTDEANVGFVVRKVLIALIKRLILRPWNWIKGLTDRLRVLPDDRSPPMILPRQLLKLGYPSEIKIVRVIYSADVLIRVSIRQMLVVEPQGSIW